MTIRSLLRTALALPDRFDAASMRSIGAERPAYPISFGDERALYRAPSRKRRAAIARGGK